MLHYEIAIALALIVGVPGFVGLFLVERHANRESTRADRRLHEVQLAACHRSNVSRATTRTLAEVTLATLDIAARHARTPYLRYAYATLMPGVRETIAALPRIPCERVIVKPR